jgi:hypothetical protein
MTAFIVRLSDNKELVGLFWSKSIKGLGCAIDEFCDPYACEYKRIDNGGIYWSDKVSIKIPILINKDEMEDDDYYEIIEKTKNELVGFEFSDAFDDAFFSENGWKKWNVPLDKFYSRYCANAQN